MPSRQSAARRFGLSRGPEILTNVAFTAGEATRPKVQPSAEMAVNKADRASLSPTMTIAFILFFFFMICLASLINGRLRDFWHSLAINMEAAFGNIGIAVLKAECGVAKRCGHPLWV